MKYVQIYANGAPQLFDEDVFKLIVPIPDFIYGSNEYINEHISEPVNEHINLSPEYEQILLEIRKDASVTSV